MRYCKAWSGCELIEGDSEVGGGIIPRRQDEDLARRFPDESLAERLRANDPRSLRALQEVGCSRCRTIFPEQIETLIAALRGSAVFLDRDGTIVRRSGISARPEKVKLLPGAAEGFGG